MKRKFEILLMVVASVSFSVMATKAAAYYVEINGQRYVATSQPSIEVQGTSSGLVVTISGGVNLGASSSSTASSATNTSTSTSTTTTTTTTTDPTTTATTTPTTSTTPTSSGAGCDTGGQVICAGTDYGPALVGSTSVNVDIKPGSIFSIPFSISDYNGSSMYGMVSTVAKTAVSLEGHTLRTWFSSEPGGKPFSSETCLIKPRGLDFSHRWNQGKDFSGYCKLPSTKSTVFVNYAVCSSDDDLCRSSSAKFPGGTVRLISTSRRIRY